MDRWSGAGNRCVLIFTLLTDHLVHCPFVCSDRQPTGGSCVCLSVALGQYHDDDDDAAATERGE